MKKEWIEIGIDRSILVSDYVPEKEAIPFLKEKLANKIGKYVIAELEGDIGGMAISKDDNVLMARCRFILITKDRLRQLLQMEHKMKNGKLESEVDICQVNIKGS